MNTDTKSKQNETRQELEWVAATLCPDLTSYLSQVTNRELATTIVESVQERLLTLANDMDVIISLNKQNAQLAQELAQARRQLEREQSRSAVLEQAMENIRLQVGSAIEFSGEAAPAGQPGKLVARNVPPYSQGSEKRVSRQPESLSRQVEKWQEKRQRWPNAFAREARLLQTLAETGVSRRMVLAEILADHLGLKPESGSIPRAFVRLGRSGWVELIEAQSEISGAGIHHLLRLTDRGVIVCKTVLGLDPVPSHLTELLSRHRTPSRVLLVLQAADLLREAGYTVNLFPNRIALSGDSGGRAFIPDLAASWRGSALLIQVEGRVIEDIEQQRRRWQDYYDATGGEFCVVAPGGRAVRRIKEDVYEWARWGGPRPELWMTNISDVRGKGLRGDEIWTREQVYPGSLSVPQVSESERLGR